MVSCLSYSRNRHIFQMLSICYAVFKLFVLILSIQDFQECNIISNIIGILFFFLSSNLFCQSNWFVQACFQSLINELWNTDTPNDMAYKTS